MNLNRRLLKTGIFTLIVVALLLVLWISSAPPSYFTIPPSTAFGPISQDIIKAKASGDPLSEKLTVEARDLPGHDEIIFQEDLGRAFVTAVDGWIWKIDLKNKKAEKFVDAPLMGGGGRQMPGNKDKIIFCSYSLNGEKSSKDEKVGIYELTISSKTIRPLINRVPNVPTFFNKPTQNFGIVYVDASPVRLSIDKLNATNSRPLMFCNDLDISRDGKRIYFTEPFTSEGASTGGAAAVAEAITLGRNGLLWCLNIEDNTIYLVAQGYSFVNGVLLEYKGVNDTREVSVLITESSRFRITRLFLRGEHAGQDQILWKDLPGMPDGMDYDSKGRIWVSLFKERSPLGDWVHNHPGIKTLLLRLPPSMLPDSKDTGIMAFSTDCSKILYYTMHKGTSIDNISNVVPSSDGRIYLSRFEREAHGHGFYSIKNPLD